MQLAEWRLSKVHDVTLPSGLQVKLRTSLQIIDLAAQGRIPSPLASLVNDIIDDKDIPTTVEIVKSYGELWDLVAKAAIVDPPIADVGDSEHLGIDELPMGDKSFIFSLLHGRATQLVPFRPEQGSTLGVTLPGEGIRSETQPDSPSPGRVDSLPVGPGVPGSGKAGRRGRHGK